MSAVTKGFTGRLADLDRASFVDVSRDLLSPDRGARRARDCVEYRTTSHVMRENGMTPDEIREGFGCLPEALPDPRP